MANITIKITGVAICYYVAPDWKVLLPFSNEHQIQFTSPTNTLPIPLKGPFKKIDISVTAPTSVATPPIRGFFDDFINIKGNECHQTIELLPTWNDAGVLMTVPYASFQKDGETKCHYRIVKGSGPGPAPNPKGYAKVVHAGKFLVEGAEIILKATGPDVEFTQHFRTNSTITIDNTCPHPPSADEGADLKLIYNLIRDKDFPGREFTMDRLPSEKPPPTGSSIKQLIDILLGRKPIEKITDNNDPEPHYPGMPCNILGGGDNPGGLP